MNTPAPLLRAQNLSYRKRIPLLSQLNFVLPEGITAVMSTQQPGPQLPATHRLHRHTPARILQSLLACDRAPTAGTIQLRQLPYGCKAYRRAVAWLPPRTQTFIGLNAREHVAYCAWLKGIPKKLAWERSLPAMTKLGLVDVAGDPVDALPALSQRLLEIARGICHDARILIVDTPELCAADRTELLETLKELQVPGLEGMLVHTDSTLEASQFADNLLLVAADSIPFAGTLTDFRAAVANNPDLLHSTPPATDTRERP